MYSGSRMKWLYLDIYWGLFTMIVLSAVALNEYVRNTLLFVYSFIFCIYSLIYLGLMSDRRKANRTASWEVMPYIVHASVYLTVDIGLIMLIVLVSMPVTFFWGPGLAMFIHFAGFWWIASFVSPIEKFHEPEMKLDIYARYHNTRSGVVRMTRLSGRLYIPRDGKSDKVSPVKMNETIFKIASQQGITRDQLLNPSDTLKRNNMRDNIEKGRTD